MKRERALRGRKTATNFACVLAATSVIFSVLLTAQSEGSNAVGASSVGNAAHGVRADDSTTTTNLTTTTTSTTMPSTTGLITAGPSRNECLTPDFNDTGLASLQATVTNFNTLTDSTVTCLSAYLGSAKAWADWESPWITDPSLGYTSWVAEAPQSRQLVLAVELIPNDLANVKDPINWEKSCALGRFNSYAKHLGTNLVAAGLENSVLRLGSEMNGVWEKDFIGTTKVEQKLWAKCFSNEVVSLRKATGEHFLIDWNVNACTGDYPYANYYPGNSYVDIVGFDGYDVACRTPSTKLSFAQLAREQLGLNVFQAFATAKRKSMSLPEWGLATVPAGDDPAYVNGIGSRVDSEDFSFETYFDGGGGPMSKALPLSTRTPLSVAAFQRWFGNKS
jgi:hypothetical protein